MTCVSPSHEENAGGTVGTCQSQPHAQYYIHLYACTERYKRVCTLRYNMLYEPSIKACAAVRLCINVSTDLRRYVSTALRRYVSSRALRWILPLLPAFYLLTAIPDQGDATRKPQQAFCGVLTSNAAPAQKQATQASQLQGRPQIEEYLACRRGHMLARALCMCSPLWTKIPLEVVVLSLAPR